MKKYLYVVYVKGGCAVYDLPAMPRVLAEKTAKILNKMKRHNEKYIIEKNPFLGLVKEGSPKGVVSWYDYMER